MNSPDIVVLGAGPAGCAAAIAALKKGLRVDLFDCRVSPTRRPGETLHPGLEPIFRQLGVWDAILACGFPRHRGIWREDLSRNRTFAPYGEDGTGPWLGFQADRAKLDVIFRERVEELGGRVVTGVRPYRLLCKGGRPIAIDFHSEMARANTIFDATGHRPWLPSRLQLDAKTFGPAQRVRFGWDRNAPAELDGQPLFRDRPDGWEWICPLEDGAYAWVELAHTRKHTGLDNTQRIFKRCAGPGYFLLGDAACLLDPSFANGVLRALLSGINAVHLFFAAAGGHISESFASDEYARWMNSMFDHYTMMRFGSPPAAAPQDRDLLPEIDASDRTPAAPSAFRSDHT